MDRLPALMDLKDAACLVGRDWKTVRRWAADPDSGIGVELAGRLYVRKAKLAEIVGFDLDEPTLAAGRAE